MVCSPSEVDTNRFSFAVGEKLVGKENAPQHVFIWARPSPALSHLKQAGLRCTAGGEWKYEGGVEDPDSWSSQIRALWGR